MSVHQHPESQALLDAAAELLKSRGRHAPQVDERDRANAAAERLRSVSGVQLLLILDSAQLLRPLSGWQFDA